MYLLLRKLLSIVFYIKYRIKVLHPERIPKLKGGYIIACNHQSNLDPPMVAAVIKGKFSFMAKEELFHINGFVTFVIKHCGAFPIARGAGDDAPIQMSIEAVKKNRILVIFPEGTRSKTGVIGRVKSGVVLIASEADVPVLPVCIRYDEKKHVTMDIGEMLPAESVKIDPNDRHSMRRSAKVIGEALHSLQKEIYDTAGLPVPTDGKEKPGSAGDSE